MDSDFNNVELALSLLDETSVGKSMSSFSHTKEMLSQALKSSVDQHYKAFADALPHHAALLNHLGQAHAQVQETRVALLETKESLGAKRADLVQLWARGQILEEMMRLLDQIEHLKSVPDTLEALISEKRLIQASVLLIRSLKLINKHDMQEIGAVTDLRGYLLGQETALRDILVDELHNHLYLKSFWCDTRWAPYTPGQSTLELECQLTQTNAPNDFIRTSQYPSPQNSQGTCLSRYLHGLATRPNDAPYDLDDASFRNSASVPVLSPSISASVSSSSNLGTLAMPNSLPLGHANANPEADSFSYIETLLESLAILGKLGSALDSVMQRLQSEIFQLIESTVDEVEERAEESKRSSAFLTGSALGSKSDGGYLFACDESVTMNPVRAFVPKGTSTTASNLRLSALESTSKHHDQETLKDLIWTIYSKLDAVIQGIRVVFEVANRIGSRWDFKDSFGAKPGTLFPIADVWLLMQTEVRTLLNDYLTDEERSAATGRNPITSINEVLRDGRFTRDRLKGIFRFSDTDAKSTGRFLRKHEDELIRVLRDTMPGLVQSSSENTVQNALSSVGSDERVLGVGQHHRLLIKPDAFHVSVLFQPTFTFLGRVASVLPDGIEIARSASQVLDDFVLKVYLPQLEEKISMLLHQAVSAPDSFQPDASSTRFSPRPILKAATQLMALVNSLCAMLRTTPFHCEKYSRLIFGVIIQFYQRCSHRFQTLVSKGGTEGQPSPSLAAQWAQRSELSPCLSELFVAGDRVIKRQLCRQESHLELSYLAQCHVDKSDLNPAVRNISALCSLYRSIAWFTRQLDSLKSSPDDALSPTSTPSQMDALSSLSPDVFSPTFSFQHNTTKDAQISLPLSHEMALRFGALLKTYTQLAEIILHTIRIEVRCRTIYYIHSAFRHGNYQVDHEAGEPDPNIVDLNSELSVFDEFTSITLFKDEQTFIFLGLEELVEQLLIENAHQIRVANGFGMKKIDRNIRALQQSIRTIGDGEQCTQFERARQYYALFSLGPQGLLDSIRTNKMFSFDEYKVILNLQCGVDQSLGDSVTSKATDRNYSMYSIELHGLELENTEANA